MTAFKFYLYFILFSFQDEKRSLGWRHFVHLQFFNFFKTISSGFLIFYDKILFFFENISYFLFSFQDEIHVEENVPWGEDTLFTLEFREEANKYSIHTCNNMYLQRDGKLVPAVNKVGSKLFNSFYIPKPFISKDFIGFSC